MHFASTVSLKIAFLVTIVRKSKVLLFDSHFHRFETIFRWCFNPTFSNDYEHLWQHASETVANFSLTTFDIDDLSVCSVKYMGLHPKMLLYALDELFHVFRGMGANDLDGQCIIAYEILSLASLHCTEQCSKPKKCHKMCSEAYLRVDLNDVDGLKHLAWVVYNGVFLPGNPPALTGHHDWQLIIVGTTLRLIYQGATVGAHCPPCTITSHNAEQAAKWQGTSQHTRRFKPQTTRSSPTLRTPMVRSVVNVPLRATSSLSTGGAPATSLGGCEEDDTEEDAFHQFHWRRVQQSGVQREATPAPHQVMHTSPSKSRCIASM